MSTNIIRRMMKWGSLVLFMGQLCESVVPVMARFEQSLSRRIELNEMRGKAIEEEKFEIVPVIEADIAHISDMITKQKHGVMEALTITKNNLEESFKAQQRLADDLMIELAGLKERMRWFDFHTFTELERLFEEDEPTNPATQVAERVIPELVAVCKRVLVMPNLSIKQAGLEVGTCFDSIMAKMPQVFVTRPLMDHVVNETKRSCFAAIEDNLLTRIRNNVHRSQDIAMDLLEIENAIARVVNV